MYLAHLHDLSTYQTYILLTYVFQLDLGAHRYLGVGELEILAEVALQNVGQHSRHHVAVVVTLYPLSLKYAHVTPSHGFTRYKVPFRSVLFALTQYARCSRIKMLPRDNRCRELWMEAEVHLLAQKNSHAFSHCQLTASMALPAAMLSLP